LPEGEAARFPVGRIELRLLHPLQQRVGRYADRLGSLIDVSLREQRGDRFFLLAPELGTVAFHWTQPGAICPRSTIAFLSPFRL
jgi:hypothetical protein